MLFSKGDGSIPSRMVVLVHRKWGVCDIVAPATQALSEGWVPRRARYHARRHGLHRTQVTWATDRRSHGQALHAFVRRGGTHDRWYCVDHYFAPPHQRKWQFPSLYARSEIRATRQFLDYAYLAWLYRHRIDERLEPWPTSQPFPAQGCSVDDGLQWLGATLAWKTLAPTCLLVTLHRQPQPEPRYARPWTSLQSALWDPVFPWPWLLSTPVASSRIQAPAIPVHTTLRIVSSFALTEPLAVVWQTWLQRPYAPFPPIGPWESLLHSDRRWTQFHPLVIHGARRFYATHVSSPKAHSIIVKVPKAWKKVYLEE